MKQTVALAFLIVILSGLFASINLSFSSPRLPTPLLHNNSLMSDPVQNHWWDVTYWATSSSNLPSFMYGSFVAAPDSIVGLANYPDMIGYLPLNVAYGYSRTNCVWFQFSVIFQAGGVVAWGIWDVKGPGQNFTDYYYTPVGLAYTPGHLYDFMLSTASGNVVFVITDDTIGTGWYCDTWALSIPSLNMLYDTSLFSPASAIEGYTTNSQLSNVPVFQTVVGTGISSYWHSFQGSGEPSGIGTTVSLRGSGYYNWSMDSGIPQNPKPIINSFTVSTNPFSPNSDGAKDTTTLAASFNVLVNWNIQAKNKYGTVIRTWKGTGLNLALVWDGKNSTGYRVADGTYNLTLSGKDQVGNNLVSKTIQVTVDTKPPSVTNAYVCPTTFSPRYAQTTKIFYTLSESSYVTIKIYNSTGSLIRTIISSNLQSSGAHAFTWNGKTSSGTTVKTGTYTFKLYVSDKAGNKASPYPILKTVKVT